MVDPKLMFDDYLYISSPSITLVNHLTNLAKEICKIIDLKKNDLIVDIGANDGCLLSQFSKLNDKLCLLGVEPAKNLVSLIEEKKDKLLK